MFSSLGELGRGIVVLSRFRAFKENRWSLYSAKNLSLKVGTLNHILLRLQLHGYLPQIFRCQMLLLLRVFADTPAAPHQSYRWHRLNLRLPPEHTQ